MNTMTYIKDLTAGTRFMMDTNTVYVCEGVGTIGNLTRVSYTLEVEADEVIPREYAFTKVSLTTARLAS